MRLNFHLDDRESSESIDDSFYDIWPLPSNKVLAADKQFHFAIEEPLLDPIKQLVIKYFGNQEANKRALPNADSVIADANGLQILIV